MTDLGQRPSGQAPDPLFELGAWIDEAATRGVTEPASVAFVTVGPDGRPSARTVSLKRLEPAALVLSTALWTRKAQELEENPAVALLFHWPTLGRQVHVTGQAYLAERALAEELWAQRNRPNQLQTLVSRQGEPIEDLAPIRARHAHLDRTLETEPGCPPDWGALRVEPETVELWSQAPDRLHDRRLYRRNADGGWAVTRLAP